MQIVLICILLHGRLLHGLKFVQAEFDEIHSAFDDPGRTARIFNDLNASVQIIIGIKLIVIFT